MPLHILKFQAQILPDMFVKTILPFMKSYQMSTLFLFPPIRKNLNLTCFHHLEYIFTIFNFFYENFDKCKGEFNS